MKKINFFLCFYVILFLNARAQQLLTEDEAISIALKNNYDILVARNDADITKSNNTPGNAGMLPAIGITGSDNFSKSHIDQKLFNGNEIKSPNASSNYFNSSVTLNWTLFDGGKMFVTKNKLKEIEALGEIQFKNIVFQTIYDVILAYYDVIRQKQQLVSVYEVISYNKELVKILQTSFDAGLSPKSGLLQAQIDLNVNLEFAIDQSSVVIAAKRNLNQLLGRDAEIPFEVTDSISVNYIPNKDALIQKVDSGNTDILSFQKQVEIAKLSLKEYNAMLLPRINFNTGYSLSQINNSSGNLLKNNSFGPVIGTTISIPLFQSGNILRQQTIAKLQIQSAEYDLENLKLHVNTQLYNALTEFDDELQLLSIEKINVALAKENLEISLQRLRLGQTTSLEVRQAQDSYEQSRTRLINFEYNLKVAETELYRLSGELIKVIE